MSLIPKKTAFRLRFRNKIKTHKIRTYDSKQCQPASKQGLTSIDAQPKALHKKLGWKPEYCYTHNHSAMPMHFKSKHTAMAVRDITDRYDVSVTQPCDRYPLWDASEIFSNRNNVNNVPVKDESLQSSLIKTANTLLFGDYGFCAMHHSTLSTKFIETAKLDIAKKLRKKGRVWLRICCDTPVTARPVETRMGKGKGSIDHWQAKVRPHQLIFEFSGVHKQILKEIFHNLSKKSGLKLKLITGQK